MTFDVHIEERAEQRTAVVHDRVPIAQIGEVIGHALTEVMAVLEEQHLQPVGPPFARYGMSADAFDVDTGFPTAGVVAPAGRVGAATLPGGPTATAMHIGPYDEVAGTYAAVLRWIESNGFEQNGDAWETYLDGPEVERPRTIVSVPVRPRSA